MPVKISQISVHPRSSAATMLHCESWTRVNMTLQKIRKASLHELRVRAAQKVAAFSERRGWSDLVKLPSDDVFAGAAHDLLEHFRSRSKPAFFASFKISPSTPP